MCVTYTRYCSPIIRWCPVIDAVLYTLSILLSAVGTQKKPPIDFETTSRWRSLAVTTFPAIPGSHSRLAGSPSSVSLPVSRTWLSRVAWLHEKMTAPLTRAQGFPSNDQSTVINIFLSWCLRFIRPPPSGATRPRGVWWINQQHHSKRCNNIYLRCSLHRNINF